MKPIEKQYLKPFILVTSLFLLWGLANNMTDTLLSAFKRIMSMSDTQTSLIQFAFYGAYFCLALPAALFIRKHSYKSGVVLGLCLYAAGDTFHARSQGRQLRFLPYCHIHYGGRMLSAGDHCQSLYPLYGVTGDRHPASEYCTGI